jgi:hypothetical protein
MRPRMQKRRRNAPRKSSTLIPSFRRKGICTESVPHVGVVARRMLKPSAFRAALSCSTRLPGLAVPAAPARRPPFSQPTVDEVELDRLSASRTTTCHRLSNTATRSSTGTASDTVPLDKLHSAVSRALVPASQQAGHAWRTSGVRGRTWVQAADAVAARSYSSSRARAKNPLRAEEDMSSGPEHSCQLDASARSTRP